MGGGIVLELSFSSGTLTSIPKLSWFPRPQAYFSLWERGANGKGSAGKAVETVRVRNTLFSLQSFRSGVLDVCAHSQLFSCALVIDQSEGRQASPHPPESSIHFTDSCWSSSPTPEISRGRYLGISAFPSCAPCHHSGTRPSGLSSRDLVPISVLQTLQCFPSRF